MKSKYFLIVAGLMLVLFSYSFAQVPQLINYQGKLTKVSGAPLDTTISMVFSIYADSAGTILKWTETQGAVAVEKGIFNVLLGNVNPIPDTVFNGNIRYLGVQVGGDPEITPRKPMVSVPYAYRSATGAGDNDWTINGDTIYHMNGNVGIGTMSPDARLAIAGTIGINPLRISNSGAFATVLTDNSQGLDQKNWQILHSGSNLHLGTLNDALSSSLLLCSFLRNGNVGIGTSSPSQKLHVYSSGTNTGIVVDGGSGGRARLGLLPGGVDGGELGYKNYLEIGTITDASLVLSPKIHITSGGNVGIGTTSPNEQLEITGNLRLPASTASVGVIKSGADRFIHNFGIGNFFAGVNAGNFTLSGAANTGVGVSALQALTTGGSNTAMGYQALSSNTTGNSNTAVGVSSLLYNTTGYWNTAMGRSALLWNTTGYNNTAVGLQALYSNSTGYKNTAMGFSALLSNTTGYNNTAVGESALYSNTTGIYNTAMGQSALHSNTTGGWNTAVGRGALYGNTTGTSNTAVGFGADVSLVYLNNATAIGYNAIVDASNKVRIGNSSVTSIGGQVGWSTFSDGRYKKSISENVPGLAFISKLKPVTYTVDVDAIDASLRPLRKPREGQTEDDFKPSAEDIASKQAQSQIVYTGFIAQEVEKAARETGYDFSGVDAPKNAEGMYGLRYADFVVPLVKAVQEQQQTIKEQQEQIKALQQRVAELEKK